MDITLLQQTLSEVHLIAPTTGVVIAAVLAAILLIMSGFASGSEIAFFSLSPQDLNQLDPDHNPTDAEIKTLRDDSERTLATILITNNFVNVTIIMLSNFVFANLVDFGKALWLFVAALWRNHAQDLCSPESVVFLPTYCKAITFLSPFVLAFRECSFEKWNFS